MQNQISQVQQFHETFGQPVLPAPEIPHIDRCSLRHRLLKEEVAEFQDAYLEGDIVAVADALTDILYVAFGAALEFGLGEQMEAFFDEVHRSNMSKAGEGGKPILSHSGKIQKGPNYSPPDLQKIFDIK